ncbi:unnamed protein product [Taenia asiatica]|uniref:DUF3453 domain-containing protein n=1 Tax=Taenia asiatica TaxID=60517 RepID=A0A0R3WFA0_TAEAS|nr:unnamed protein product [Taenia asiatica]
METISKRTSPIDLPRPSLHLPNPCPSILICENSSTLAVSSYNVVIPLWTRIKDKPSSALIANAAKALTQVMHNTGAVATLRTCVQPVAIRFPPELRFSMMANNE